MRTPKVDPKVLEHEYVTTDISIRELARRHDMSWSAIAARSRKDQWQDKRDSYKDSLARRTYERTADKFAMQDADIRAELVQVNRATLAMYIEQLKEGQVRVTPKDAVLATTALLNLLGEPTSRTETQIVDLSGTRGGFESGELRRLIEVARSRIIEGTVAGPTESEPGRTRPN